MARLPKVIREAVVTEEIVGGERVKVTLFPPGGKGRQGRGITGSSTTPCVYCGLSVRVYDMRPHWYLECTSPDRPDRYNKYRTSPDMPILGH